MIRMRALTVALAILFAFPAAAVSDPHMSSEPIAVDIVTTDIPNFWRAFDDASRARTKAQRAKIFGEEYFLPGSDGLWGFVGGRLQSPRYVAEITAKQRADYIRVRSVTERMPSAVPKIFADFKRFKNFYPDAQFPKIYFVIGVWNSGGTSIDWVGDIIGAEVIAKMGLEVIPGLVTHETVHWNQHDPDENTLLDATLIEGSADFIAELADGHVETDAQWQFGCSHEQALWTLYQQQMLKQDDALREAWLFSDHAPLQAPPFIGYWIGYRIVQSYYDQSTDKRAAINAILHIKDSRDFLASSGYDGVKPGGTCQRVTRWGG